MIKDVLNEHLVQTNVQANTWREVVVCCGDLLEAQKKIDSEFTTSMIQTVEELGPYMILVPEIAFFHGPPSEHVHEACLSFVTLEEDVVFDDFDGQVIKSAFAFGAKDKDSHMEMLMKIAELLQDEEFLELARNRGSKEDIMKIIGMY